MKAKIFSNKKLIGNSDLYISDESMGVVSGKFIPNDNYDLIRKEIWDFHNSDARNKCDDLDKLRLNAQLANNVFLYPLGGFLITDFEELSKEELEFEAAGNYRHVIEDNFLASPPKERIFEPWEYISIEQKIAFEDQLKKEIGKERGVSSFKKHKLCDYEFNAMATMVSNDVVLFSINKEGENKYEYAVVHLIWTGSIADDKYPRIEFFKDFDHFLYDRLYPDKADWEY